MFRIRLHGICRDPLGLDTDLVAAPQQIGLRAVTFCFALVSYIAGADILSMQDQLCHIYACHLRDTHW